MIQTGYPDTNRRQKRSSWLSLAERVIPHSVGKCPEGQKGRASFKMEDKLSSLTKVLIRGIET